MSPFYTKPRIRGWHCAITVIASLALLIANQKAQESMSPLAATLGSFIQPIRYTVDLPVGFIKQAQWLYQERMQLLLENDQLQQQQILLRAQMQKYQSLESENKELKQLLQSVGPQRESYFAGKLLQTSTDPFSQTIMIDQGTQNGVHAGQPVLDAYGLVGVVIAPHAQMTQVLLVTDPGFAVPVQSVRSRERAIATGSGIGKELRLNYVPRTADFIEGDQLVTSGLGGKFPAGYPVGKITSIQHDPGDRFTVIGIDPNARLNNLQHVLFVKHKNLTLAQGYPAKPEMSLEPLEIAQNALAKTTPSVYLERTLLSTLKPVDITRLSVMQAVPEPSVLSKKKSPSASPKNSFKRLQPEEVSQPSKIIAKEPHKKYNQYKPYNEYDDRSSEWGSPSEYSD